MRPCQITLTTCRTHCIASIIFEDTSLQRHAIAGARGAMHCVWSAVLQCACAAILSRSAALAAVASSGRPQTTAADPCSPVHAACRVGFCRRLAALTDEQLDSVCMDLMHACPTGFVSRHILVHFPYPPLFCPSALLFHLYHFHHNI